MRDFRFKNHWWGLSAVSHAFLNSHFSDKRGTLSNFSVGIRRRKGLNSRTSRQNAVVCDGLNNIQSGGRGGIGNACS